MDVIHLVECVAISMMEETKARVRQNFSVQFTVVNLFNLLLIVRLKPNETSARRLDKWLVMDRVWIEYVIFKSIDEQ